MTPSEGASKYKYDFALSFAGEDRSIVEQVNADLQANGLPVFYDFDEQELLLGRDLAEHFAQLYENDAEYCVMFVSRHYKRKAWPRWERRSAIARAFRSRKEYVLPYFLDNSRLPVIPATIGRASFPEVSPEQFARMLIRKHYLEHGRVEVVDGVLVGRDSDSDALSCYNVWNPGNDHSLDGGIDVPPSYEFGVVVFFYVSNQTGSNLILDSDDFGSSRTGGQLDTWGTFFLEDKTDTRFGYEVWRARWDLVEEWADRERGLITHQYVRREEPHPGTLSSRLGIPEVLSRESFGVIRRELIASNFAAFDNLRFDLSFLLRSEANGRYQHHQCSQPAVIYSNRVRFGEARVEKSDWPE